MSKVITPQPVAEGRGWRYTSPNYNPANWPDTFYPNAGTMAAWLMNMEGAIHPKLVDGVWVDVGGGTNNDEIYEENLVYQRR